MNVIERTKGVKGLSYDRIGKITGLHSKTVMNVVKDPGSVSWLVFLRVAEALGVNRDIALDEWAKAKEMVIK